MSTSGSPIDPERERRRLANRENLRAHYNLQRKQSSTAASSPASDIGPSAARVSRGEGVGQRPGPAGQGSRPSENGRGRAVAADEKTKGKGKADQGEGLDLDSPNFSAELYFTELVTTSSLTQLMKKSTQLTTDASFLLSSRHSLVYNHHHQLTSASQTISSLNAKLPELVALVEQLGKGGEGMGVLMKEVEGKGESELMEAGGLEKKMMRELPRRLRLMSVAGDPPSKLSATLDSHTTLLAKLTNEGIADEVDAIRGECLAIIAEARAG